MKKAICLIGFMGSGKTTIGKALANILHYSWIDLDQYIEEACSETITNLFENKGEAYFRDLEVSYLKKALDEEIGVISTGGGIIVTTENREVLKKQNTFYLYYDYDTLYKRIAGDTKRPLASTYEAVKERYIQRQALYEASAKYIINGEGKSIEEVVNTILEILKDKEGLCEFGSKKDA
ncbi:shikimate kinase [Cellulosilyticum lentocellum]|uniref:Shikimate kinase n=1 Tax=Cellulosilyticum lentocellum (strain ATCC 49066 / DSM 5427 / NCIMB 11756 / RHM5) TaxID=642492 RepID=F2JMD8_CELLD|nr:shikimate kinase [Cellulosilyticum lentocellum]ADZ83456.1 Shikimate kinase [Cellulosilyticum lentocellum DSM 5427]